MKALEKQDVVQGVRDNLDVLIKAQAEQNGDDRILAWMDLSLAVKFSPAFQPIACSVWMAEAIVPADMVQKMPEDAWGFIPNVVNGRGEQAKLVKRADAIAEAILQTEGLIAWAENLVVDPA